MQSKEIKEYDGRWRTSGCNNDFDCPHEEEWDELHYDCSLCKGSKKIMVCTIKDPTLREVDCYGCTDAGYKRIAAILGARKSEKKAISSRENGKKGGRPKKPLPTLGDK